MPELKFHITKKGGTKGNLTIDDYKAELYRRAARLKGWYGEHVYKAMVPRNGKYREWAHKWSGYFRANWNVTIGNADFHTIGVRGWEDEGSDIEGAFASQIEKEKAQNTLNTSSKSLLSAPIYICNGVFYGKWLRDGIPQSYISGMYSHLTPGKEMKQSLQMAQVHGKPSIFTNFQQEIEDESKLINWDDVMFHIRREKEGHNMTDDLHVKTYVY